MPYRDPIPELKRQLGVELAVIVARWNPSDIASILETEPSRIADLRRGELKRFSLESLIRFLGRLGRCVELQVGPPPRFNNHLTKE